MAQLYTDIGWSTSPSQIPGCYRQTGQDDCRDDADRTSSPIYSIFSLLSVVVSKSVLF